MVEGVFRGAQSDIDLVRLIRCEPSTGHQRTEAWGDMADWHFYPQTPTDPIYNPISGEFFSTEAVGDVTEAVIREAVQNTLDARRADGSERRAQVRIFLSERAEALAPSHAQRWFYSLWPHVLAPGNGLRNQPSPDDPCPFVVLEDFGTIGLTGNPEEHEVIDGVANHFLNFFRAEGHSDKGESERGSWGVGKTVFPRASRISSFFGLTVRSDDGRHLLLGRSILKYHRVNGQSYKSDGYFGLQRDDGFVRPTADPSTLAAFRSDFRLKREDEPGLSVVVPWYEVDGDDSISRERVVEAVLCGLFYPILMGSLSVTIATPTEEVTLDADSIANNVKSIGGSLAQRMLPLIGLTEWAQTRVSGEFRALLAPPAEATQKWSAHLVPADVLKHIRESLAQRQRVALRVPTSVHLRTDGPHQTFFNLFLEHSDADREKPLFIRDELIISDVRPPRIAQVRSLVIVEDPPLATLLRDAETPAHTQWNQHTEKFKNKYKFGPSVITFVSSSVSKLLEIVNQSQQQPDPTITIDFFSVPAPPDDDDAVPARRRRPKGKGEEPGQEPVEVKNRHPRRFRIEQLPGGFRLIPGDTPIDPPMRVRVRVAYDVRRGNPLRRFHPADADLRALTHQAHEDSVTVDSVSAEANKGVLVDLTVRKPEFRIDYTGFDPDRDLYVKADEVKEGADGD
jgi:hypothetical protein